MFKIIGQRSLELATVYVLTKVHIFLTYTNFQLFQRINYLFLPVIIIVCTILRQQITFFEVSIKVYKNLSGNICLQNQVLRVYIFVLISGQVIFKLPFSLLCFIVEAKYFHVWLEFLLLLIMLIFELNYVLSVCSLTIF